MKDAMYYFNKIQKQKAIIAGTMEEVERLKELTESVGALNYEEERVQTSGPGDGMNLKVKEMDLEAQLHRMIQQHVKTVVFMLSVIRRLDDAKQIEVVNRRYMQDKPTRVVAEEMGVSQRWVQNTCADGLRAVDEILAKYDKNSLDCAIDLCYN